MAKSLTDRVQAGGLVKQLTSMLGGGGGGRPESAQGRGKDESKAGEAVEAAQQALRAAGLRP